MIFLKWGWLIVRFCCLVCRGSFGVRSWVLGIDKKMGFFEVGVVDYLLLLVNVQGFFGVWH